MTRRWSTLSSTAVAFGVCCQSSAWACPMCKMALETDDPQPRAYMISILFMLGMMASVTTAVGAVMYWVNRCERRALEAAGYHHVLHNAVNAPATAADASA